MCAPGSSPSQAQGPPSNGSQSQNPQPAATLQPGDPKAGKIIFLQCAACHSLESDVNKQGPSLARLFGRKAGSVEDFNYSDSNKNSGIVWDETVLRKYLADPQSVVPGTKMTFPGLKDPKQIEDVIAYLKEASKPQ
jgi:cytochrome c